jgi:hypothetical protein
MSQVREDDLAEFWTMGLIPAFVGIGLLIFYAMSKNLALLAIRDAEGGGE